ncbi:MAG: hypothetical protein JNK65_07590 [Deltaproteobacteria bacterium]|nr:hypothetical protein [Deltaproteobacteria bacterium]
MKKEKNKKLKGGFRFFRSKNQIIEYLNTPHEAKLRWLEEMRELNKLLAESNPILGEIQEKFRKGEI